MEDDLDTPKVMALVFDTVRQANVGLEAGGEIDKPRAISHLRASVVEAREIDNLPLTRLATHEVMIVTARKRPRRTGMLANKNGAKPIPATGACTA